MIEEERRPRYWLYTLALAAGVVGLTFACALVFPAFVPELNANSLLGFPLGFYFAAQGLVIVLIIAVYWAAGQQSDIDHKFGAIEDL